MKSPEEVIKPRSSWYIKLFLLLIIAVIIYGLFHYGFIKKNCKQDQECFYAAAKTCKPAKLDMIKNGNYYDYSVKGKRGSDCLVYVKLQKMAVGSPADQVALFEGKDMSCKIPLTELEKTSFADLKGFVNYCHGTLKEAIYEQIITKMYGLIIQNMDEILKAGTSTIS